MPYPNDKSLNVVLTQTSASVDGSGKFPFTERIISGSNLFILTDANGNLTGSTSIPGGSFTNLTVTGALTASIISASNSITAAAATFVGPVTMSSTLSASGGIITSTISASSNVYISGSLTVIGNIIGTIDSASVVSIAPINDGSTYYVTFVDSISGSRQLKTDADILSYTPSTNILAVGTSASGSITVGAKVTMQDLGGTSQLRVGINTTDTASLLVSSNAFQVIKGQGPGVDKVFTNLELSASNNVLFSNTTQATDWNNGALNVVGGVGIGKNLYVSGSLNAIGVISASAGITSSASNLGTLTVVGNSVLSNVFVTNITASNISASGFISASTLRVETSIVDGGSLTVLGNTVLGDTITDTTIITGSTSISGSLTVVGNTTLQNTFVTNLTASIISASGNISGNDGIFAGDIAVNGGDVTTTLVGTATLFNTNATSVNIGGGATNTVLLGNGTGVVKTAGDFVLGINNAIKDTSGTLGLTVSSSLTTVAGDLLVGGNDIKDNSGVNNLTLGVTKVTVPLTTQATSFNNGALVVDGGVGIGKNLHVSGSTFLYGDLTIYGTGSVVNISSSTVIIGDNRIQLNAGVPIQRYAGIDVFDSGSGTFTNNVTSSLLWDGLNDYWVLVSANSSSGAPLTQSSAIMIGGPTGSFGGESLLTANYIPKVQSSGRNLQNSLLSDNGTTLSYAGTGISASQVTSSQLTVQYTGSITYATGVYITYTTGSFTTITITTGSNPGLGDQVPSSPTANGLAGQINVDNNFIYVYTNQVWKRVPLSTWTA